MKAYTYLSQISKIDDMIQKKQEQIDSLRALASSTAMHTDSERVQSSGSKDKIGECICKVADLCTEINNDIDVFVDTKADIMHTIDKLEDLSERQLLYCRYFQFNEFYKIAQEMHVSERQVYRIHKAALEHIDEILKVDSSCHEQVC
ncbi:MAG: DUF1492 domain-containing protein [Lachnotalea sp.]